MPLGTPTYAGGSPTRAPRKAPSTPAPPPTPPPTPSPTSGNPNLPAPIPAPTPQPVTQQPTPPLIPSLPGNTPSQTQYGSRAGEGARTGSMTNSYNPMIAQFNAWATAQQDQGFGSYLGQVGLTGAMNRNNLQSLQDSSASDLARLMEQQYRDVALGKEGNNLDRAYAGQILGFANRGLGLAGEGRDLDIRGAGLKRDMGYRANLSDATSRGALTTSGYTQGDRDILGQFRLASDNANLGYKGAELTNDRAKADYGNTMGKLALNDKALDSLAKEYGVRAGDITNQLKAATTKLNLDYASTITQLNDQLASGNQDLVAQAQNFLIQIMGLPDNSPVISTLPVPKPQYDNTQNPDPSTSAQSQDGAGGDAENRVWAKLPNGTYAEVPASRVNDQEWLKKYQDSAS